MKLATAAQMQEMDTIAIQQRGIPSLQLMERAAEGVAAAVEEVTAGKAGRCAVFVGTGNNGGDGVAAARILAHRGWKVAVYLVGSRDKLSADNAAMVRRLDEEAGLELKDFPTVTSEGCALYDWCEGCDAIVDALFGVGLCRDVEGIYAAVVDLMNNLPVPTVSVDIASGLSADTGKVLGVAVRAAVTVTFSMAKVGQFVDQGALFTGKLIVHDIGIPRDVLQGEAIDTGSIDDSFFRSMLPPRRRDGHKGDFGKDYIIAGSIGYTGAPVLAAHACQRSGAGMVTVGTPEGAYPIVAGKCLEEMVHPLPEEGGRLSAQAREGIMDYAASCDAVLLGPGLGRSAESDALVCDLVEALPQPLILDADGINAVSSHIDSLKQRGRRVTILTPHDVEFARLGGDLEHQDRAAAARSFALEHGCILVLKGHRTIVASPDGRVAVNTTGNSGMAKGGSGDVLSGMLLALLGQGMEPYEAACAAAYLHGRAGDLAARDLGEHGMTPSDMIQRIPAAIMELI